MYIYSENIRRYIMNNMNFKNEKTIENIDLECIKNININKLNYNLNEAVFIPEELKMLINLEKIIFNGFYITDRIIKNLIELPKLKEISFDFCKYNEYGVKNFILSSLRLKKSDINLLSIFNEESLSDIILEDIENLDFSILSRFENIELLYLLNCNVKNFRKIKNLRNLKKISIIGCKLDDIEILKELNSNINISYSDKKYLYVG